MSCPSLNFAMNLLFALSASFWSCSFSTAIADPELDTTTFSMDPIHADMIGPYNWLHSATGGTPVYAEEVSNDRPWTWTWWKLVYSAAGRACMTGRSGGYMLDETGSSGPGRLVEPYRMEMSELDFIGYF